MEPEQLKEAGEAGRQTSERSAQSGPQDDFGENDKPVVLPVVVVPVEPSQAGQIAAKTEHAADVPTADSQQPSVEGDGPAQIRLGPEVVAPEVRDLVDRLRPRHELELPLASQADDGPAEDDLTMEQAVGHFVSLAEDRMRDLNLGEGEPGARAIGTHVDPAAGEMDRAILRHDDKRGTIRQLSDSRAPDESSGPDRGAGFPAGPAMVAVETPHGDGAAPMPRLQIVVQMADVRDLYDLAIDEALKRRAGEYREIAQSEVKLGFWRYENERRRADWRLRR
jgi:hypothetical protein